jgi:predicted outer membrane repeat protein
MEAVRTVSVVRTAWLVLGAAVIAGPVLAATYHVNPEGTGDFPTIQAAIDGVAHADTIALADGVFTGTGNRNVDFHGKAATVLSEGGKPANCVIDCQGQGRGFGFFSGEGSGSRLVGITITHGSANNGGAMTCTGGSTPRISRCAFLENHGDWGGAVACFESAAPTLENCCFASNTADYGGAISGWGEYCAPVIDGCTLVDNEANWGGAIWYYGSDFPIIRHCTITGNSASAAGGGVYIEGGCPILEHTIIAFSPSGEAIALNSGNTALTCCDLYNNAWGDWEGPLSSQYGIGGNISEDPLFCGEPEGLSPYMLWEYSPCAAQNNPDCGQIGAWGVGCTGLLVLPDGTGEFPTIQAAIAAAGNGEIICLGDGTFTGPGNRNLDLLGKAIEVRSLNGNPSACVVDCQRRARGFVCASGEGPGTVIRGLTVTHGQADVGGAVLCDGASPELVRCVLAGNTATSRGGAIHCSAAAPSLVNCTLSDNQAPRGGGVSCTGSSSPVLANTVIAFSPAGEAVQCDWGSAATLSCCDLFGNAGGDWVGVIAPQYGTAGNIAEDPLFCTPGDFGLRAGSPCAPFTPPNPECDLIGAVDVGCAGVYVVKPDGTGDFPTIQAAIDAAGPGAIIELANGTYEGQGNRNVTFHGKAITVRSQTGIPGACVLDCQGAARGFQFADHEGWSSVVQGLTITNGSSAAGGAIRCQSSSSPQIVECTFHGNTASSGGAIWMNDSSPWLRRCTITSNGASNGGGLACLNDSRPIMENCLITWSSPGEAIFCYTGGLPTLQCCDLYGNAGGDWTGVIESQYGVRGNIAADPFYCDAAAGDFRLEEFSPCAPFTPPNPECDLIGAWPVGCWSGLNEFEAPPAAFELRVIGPNPFQSCVRFSYNRPAVCDRGVPELSIHDLTGRLIRVLGGAEEGVSEGTTLIWNGADDAGTQVPSGLYYCRLRCGDRSAVRPVLRIR